MNMLEKEKMDAILQPLYKAIDQHSSADGHFIVAIDGCCAGGKTTLAEYLKKKYDCTVFHMDDYFLQSCQRTQERLAEPGGNLDRERFMEEILLPLKKGEAIKFRKFDCSTMSLGEPISVAPAKLVIVEGSYSMHPLLAEFYDYSLFIRIPAKLQRERIQKRCSAQKAEQFFTRWIPMENRYFEEFQVASHCNLIV